MWTSSWLVRSGWGGEAVPQVASRGVADEGGHHVAGGRSRIGDRDHPGSRPARTPGWGRVRGAVRDVRWVRGELVPVGLSLTAPAGDIRHRGRLRPLPGHGRGLLEVGTAAGDG